MAQLAERLLGKEQVEGSNPSRGFGNPFSSWMLSRSVKLCRRDVGPCRSSHRHCEAKARSAPPGSLSQSHLHADTERGDVAAVKCAIEGQLLELP